MFSFKFEAIGTSWEIATNEPLSQPLQERVLARTRQFDATYSRFRPDSLVSQVRAATSGGRFDFPDDSVPLFDLYDRLHEATAVTRRAWGKGLHHVLDGRTGLPVRDVVATWVVADDAAAADGLATALFFTSADRLERAFRFTSVRMFADGRVEVSQGFEGEVFSRKRSPRGQLAANGTPKRGGITLAGIGMSLAMAGCPTIGMATDSFGAAPESAVTRPRAAARQAPYADGVYTATGKYGSQPSFVTVTVTLAGGVIRDVTVTPHATNPTSLDLQRRFAAAVPAVVVGKRIDDVKVGRLAGSSNTPGGFNAALEQIKAQARKGSRP